MNNMLILEKKNTSTKDTAKPQATLPADSYEYTIPV